MPQKRKRRSLSYTYEMYVRRTQRRLNSALPVADADDINTESLSESQHLQSLHDPEFLKLRQQFGSLLNNIHTLKCENCKEKSFVQYRPQIHRCHKCRGNNPPTKFTIQNNMDPGPIPAVLQQLTTVEQLLIAQVNPIMSVFKLPRGGQYGFKGHVLNVPQDINQFLLDLPRRSDQVDILVLQKQGCQGNLPKDFFTVRRQKVLDALKWLKSNNIYYHNINIIDDNIQQLPENGILELNADQRRFDQNNSTDECINLNLLNNNNNNNLPSNENDNVLIGEPIPNSFVPVQVPLPTEHEIIKAAIQNNDILEWPRSECEPINEFQTVGYLARAFPCLYPTGAADLRAPREHRVTQSEYFKHMLKYHDGRFEKNPRFVYLAFNSCQRWQSLQVGKVFIKNNPNEAQLSVEDIKTMVENQQKTLANRILRFGSNIRGTAQYWFTQKSNLLAMIKQLGNASLFFTFSVADMHWPDVASQLSYDNDINNNNDNNIAETIANTPVTLDSYLTLRFQIFFKHFLVIYFNITDFWYRFEWQSRGSLHVHGLAWLHDKLDTKNCSENEIQQFTDKYVSAWNTSLKEGDNPLSFFHHIDIHPCSIGITEVQDLDNDLKQLINTCQRHTRCSTAYCLRENSNGEQKCRFNFPKQLHQSTFVDFTANEQGRRTNVTIEPARNDPLLNTYNAHCLSLWRANMDINVGMDLTDVAYYIAKYASKAEQASKNYIEIFQNIVKNQLPEQAPFQRSVNALLLKTVGQLDISAQQAAHICSGNALLHCSREFVPCYVNGKTFQDELNGNQPSDIRKYMCRPVELEDIALLAMLKQYKLKYVSGNVVCSPRAKEAIVRIMPHLSHSPTSQQYSEYCMQYLALNKPFRQWAELTDGFTNPIEAMQAFTNETDRVLLGHNSEDIDLAVQRAAVEINDHSTEPPEQDYNVDPWMALVDARIHHNSENLSENFNDFDWSAAGQHFQHLIRPAITFIQEQRNADVEINSTNHQSNWYNFQHLNSEQQEIYNYITNSDNDQPLSVLVLGTAGTGKSYLINCLKQNFLQTCVVLAPTGVAALNISGETIHSFLMFAKTNQAKPLRNESLLHLQQKCQDIKYIIIDELSMIGCRLLQLIDMRLRQAFPHKADTSFGGCNVIMFGDLGQLPPVADSRLFKPNKSELALQGHAVYQQFTKVFFLRQCMRQADDNQFREALLRLRDGAPTQADYHLYSQRFSGIADSSSFKDCIKLYPTVADVNAYNLEKLQQLGQPIANIESVHSNPQAATATSNTASGLERYTSLAIGAKIMLRTNLWVKHGLVNGSLGTVLHIVYGGNQSPPSLPAIVICHFPGYTGPPFLPDKPHTVPITPLSRQWSSDDNTTTLQRTGLPLTLAWALTIHKCQGLTLRKAFVSLGDKEMSTGISFVALSRVKNLVDLLLNPFSFDRISNLHTQNQLQERLREEDRLQLLI